MLHFLIQLLSSKLKHKIPYSKIIPKPILCLHSDLTPWMRSEHQQPPEAGAKGSDHSSAHEAVRRDDNDAIEAAGETRQI